MADAVDLRVLYSNEFCIIVIMLLRVASMLIIAQQRTPGGQKTGPCTLHFHFLEYLSTKANYAISRIGLPSYIKARVSK